MEREVRSLKFALHRVAALNVVGFVEAKITANKIANCVLARLPVNRLVQGKALVMDLGLPVLLRLQAPVPMWVAKLVQLHLQR